MNKGCLGARNDISHGNLFSVGEGSIFFPMIWLLLVCFKDHCKNQRIVALTISKSKSRGNQRLTAETDMMFEFDNDYDSVEQGLKRLRE